MHQNDLRVRKTRAKIKRALIETINEKGFGNLTVSDITERARINRGTFYIHYKGKQDLLNQLEENVYADIIKLFHENGTISSATSYEDLNEQFFQKFSAYIYGERDFILAMVLGNGDPMFYHKVKQILIRELLKRMDYLGIKMDDEIPREYIQEYAIGSMLNLSIYWLEKDDPESPSEFTKIMMHTRTKAPLSFAIKKE
ncbi:TetR family transcriptional regulator [Ligilactobacillus salivarius]|uniref:TetR/AcrR family transcriptional regulator n=1 Tax=Ligilactobacillus salivarius TaxID=1624 RepID=A0AAW6Q464_9LACO|nr:TetR/AcrR family transcriptional regulator [Ligilactobacillus salivarius]PEG95993.1 TetR/AcrR family transcriptional regulator [Lactobacillus sp. UMNPBX9]MBZ4025599.1 TetR/AcrR family transcriptional regulator [Ligilactobacillus salivarius]MBZ4030015.1 TetR/AcrR family transcriptional regulator [Ligilactobacillus salivarius]MBZ4032209.1 TetR/AcrR family transcriptional regulator [Ligilactobacillus salivarius]MDF4186817.1 TetR/AcrR family transcriptional regulator [Ligilactobacillus salivari